MPSQINLEIMHFVETQILPRYVQFDRAHNLSHVQQVIKASIALANKTGADVDMCYTIAAYHDLGLEGPRAVHHITSGKILTQDVRLKKWFSAEQIRIMREAVEDHRASASRAPRSIYGRIVAEADRDLRAETVFSRAIMFGLDNYPELDYEGQYKRFCEHMQQKYSQSGYMTLWIQGSDNEKNLRELRDIIHNPKELRKHFDNLFASLTKDTNPL